MSASGDNPEVHRITDGRFVCTAPPEAPCRNYPSCECEVWTRELHGQTLGQPIGWENGRRLYAGETIPPAPGHEPVQQHCCWIDPWVNDVGLEESYDMDAGDVGVDWSFPDGTVTAEFHGDYLTWRYADNTRPVAPADEDAGAAS